MESTESLGPKPRSRTFRHIGDVVNTFRGSLIRGHAGINGIRPVMGACNWI